MKKTKLTRSLLAACSIVALSAVAYGCSSGISQSEADRQAEAAAAAAQAAAEEAARKAAEEAAAAAAAAAAEAAAQAERDKQEAVEAARQAAIAEREKMAVMDAITAAQASVDALMDDSSDADVAGAAADIAAATAAIAAATSFSEADMAMYSAQVTNIQANLTLVQANIRAHRAEMAAEEAEQQATAAERAKTAVENAIAALNAASEAEDAAEATYSVAAATLAEAQQAVADADDDTLADASAALAQALIAASTAAADLGVRTQAVADATAALEATRATLAAVDPDHVALQAANAALTAAKAERDALTRKVAELQQQIEDLREQQRQDEEDRRQAAEERERQQRMADMAAAGKALHAALGTNPLAQLDGTTTAHAIASKELNLTEGGPLTGATPAVVIPNMEAGDSAGSLGGWMGTNYAHMDTGTKVANSAVVYTNQGDPTTKTFASEYGAGNPSADDGTYDSAARKLTITGAGLTTNAKIKGAEFATAGTKTHTPRVAGGTEVSFSGMYDGVSGTYICTAGACTSTYNDSGITLAGTWEFVHPQGAMISRPDPTYLFFGWWLRKDEDGPTHASAFTGTVGAADDITAITPTAVPTTGGSATYTGAAAGKFAINNPLGGSDAGHFTADATLTAKFGGTGAGVTGTINNFMANGNAVPWSVALNNNTLDGDTVGAAAATNVSATGAITSAGSFDTATPNVDESKTTVWSIDGNAAPASGTWSGQMYDEMPGNAPSGDGSNVPTSVTGVFQSMFGSTHTMVGAFGAERQ